MIQVTGRFQELGVSGIAGFADMHFVDGDERFLAHVRVPLDEARAAAKGLFDDFVITIRPAAEAEESVAPERQLPLDTSDILAAASVYAERCVDVFCGTTTGRSISPNQRLGLITAFTDAFVALETELHLQRHAAGTPVAK